MASRFASQILYFSNCNAITEHLSDSQKVFIVDLILALETFPREGKWNRAIISGAAFLYWMFGISESADVRHTVLGILRTSKRITRADAITRADDLIVRKVQNAIDAMMKTFGSQGKPLNVQKETEITTSLLATWSDKQPTPIHTHPNFYEAAQLCVIYKPEELILSSQNGDLARTYYVDLLARIVGEEFDLSRNINDEILQEYLAKNEDYETLRNTAKLKVTKKSKGKLTGIEENQVTSRDSDANSAVNVVSYPCGRGHRTIFDQSGCFKSVPRSTWLKFNEGDKEAIVTKEIMTYDQYKKLVDKAHCRIKLSRVKGYHIIAVAGGKWKLIIVEKFDEQQEQALLGVIELEDGLASFFTQK